MSNSQKGLKNLQEVQIPKITKRVVCYICDSVNTQMSATKENNRRY